MARVSAMAWTVLAMGLGCGYRFLPRDEMLPEGVRAVCAPMFRNDTPEPGLETLFTRAFRQEMMRAGTLGGGGTCDANLEGVVTYVGSWPTIVTEPLFEETVDEQGNKNRRQIRDPQLASYRASASAVLKLTKDGRVLAETSVSGTEDYLPGSGDVLQAEANRQAALHRLSETLMREGYERLAQSW
jgi:hypothetical protein